ncbi:MAG: hypothetical protein KC766_38510, partial [Myxococcales bacterium]|nr:hypothetical protein [Myxococcales bacterium]
MAKAGQGRLDVRECQTIANWKVSDDLGIAMLVPSCEHLLFVITHRIVQDDECTRDQTIPELVEDGAAS